MNYIFLRQRWFHFIFSGGLFLYLWLFFIIFIILFIILFGLLFLQFFLLFLYKFLEALFLLFNHLFRYFCYFFLHLLFDKLRHWSLRFWHFRQTFPWFCIFLLFSCYWSLFSLMFLIDSTRWFLTLLPLLFLFDDKNTQNDKSNNKETKVDLTIALAMLEHFIRN